MKTYTESKPVFSEEIPVTEPTDPAHADNINAAPKQLLQNTLVNHASIQELEKGNQMVEFEDYSSEGTDVPDPEAAISQVSSGKADKVFRQYVKASLKGLLNLAQRALNVAMGKNQARVFATVEALDAWLAVPANVKQLNAGDHFYIVDTDVPDYWWDGTKKQVLEAQKVDLTTYDQKISELYGNISSHKTSADHDGRYYTETEVNALLAGKSDTTHTHNYLPPVWANYGGVVDTNTFQGSFTAYKRNGNFKQFSIQGSLLSDLAAKSGSRYIGWIPEDARPEIKITFPGITKNGKTIWITIGTNGAVNVENYSLNAAVVAKNDHFELTHVYY